MKKQNLKSRWLNKKATLKEKNLNLAHPVVKASYIWNILSDQLCDVLGAHVHHQWFKEVKPLVISHNVLILEVPSHFTAQWIHTHYHELIDILLSAIDKNLSSFFVSQSERKQNVSSEFVRVDGPAVATLESSASKIKRNGEDENGQPKAGQKNDVVLTHD